MKKIILLVLSLFYTVVLFSQNIVLSSQTEVDSFLNNNPTIYPGVLTIEDDNDGIDNITSLASLSSLQRVQGVFTITNNANLPSLQGLESLDFAGSLRINNNNQLEDLEGLNSFTSTLGDLFITFNDNLLNVDALLNFTNIVSYGGSFAIIENNKLENLSGFSSLASEVIIITIVRNDVLTSLAGLDNLFVADIQDQNQALNIIDNPMLSVCEIVPVCTALSNPEILTLISGNASNCETLDEVVISCDPTSTNQLSTSLISYYPNPMDDYLIIESPENGKLELLTTTGQTVKTIFLEKGINRLGVNDMKSGIYFLYFKSRFIKKVVKI